METAAIAFGSAFFGALAAFLGAIKLESNRTSQRRRGILASLEGDLSSNVIKMTSMRDRLSIPIEDRSFDLIGPPTTDFWKSMRVEIGSLLPLELFLRLHMAYEELSVFRTSTEAPPLLVDTRTASTMIDLWIEDVELLQDELFTMHEIKKQWRNQRGTLNQFRESTEIKKAVVTQRMNNQSAINDLMNGSGDQTK